MKNRGERREVNYRKWMNKLRELFNSDNKRYTCKVKSKRTKPNDALSYDELKSVNWGVIYKNTRTPWKHYSRWEDIRDLHKRNLANRTVPEEQIEEYYESKCH